MVEMAIISVDLVGFRKRYFVCKAHVAFHIQNGKIYGMDQRSGSLVSMRCERGQHSVYNTQIVCYYRGICSIQYLLYSFIMIQNW